jgi:hypothetical protein
MARTKQSVQAEKQKRQAASNQSSAAPDIKHRFKDYISPEASDYEWKRDEAIIRNKDMIDRIRQLASGSGHASSSLPEDVLKFVNSLKGKDSEACQAKGRIRYHLRNRIAFWNEEFQHALHQLPEDDTSAEAVARSIAAYSGLLPEQITGVDESIKNVARRDLPACFVITAASNARMVFVHGAKLNSLYPRVDVEYVTLPHKHKWNAETLDRIRLSAAGDKVARKQFPIRKAFDVEYDRLGDLDSFIVLAPAFNQIKASLPSVRCCNIDKSTPCIFKSAIQCDCKKADCHLSSCINCWARVYNNNYSFLGGVAKVELDKMTARFCESPESYSMKHAVRPCST